MGVLRVLRLGIYGRAGQQSAATYRPYSQVILEREREILYFSTLFSVQMQLLSDSLAIRSRQNLESSTLRDLAVPVN